MAAVVRIQELLSNCPFLDFDKTGLQNDENVSHQNIYLEDVQMEGLYVFTG